MTEGPEDKFIENSTISNFKNTQEKYFSTEKESKNNFNYLKEEDFTKTENLRFVMQ
jgi:hypothetical protein